jgi:formylglycine-generating enzyme
MLRRLCLAALAALMALGGLDLVIEPSGCGTQPRSSPPDKTGQAKTRPATIQITNSIGMKLVLIPAGEFMMGSGESAEKTATFFGNVCGPKHVDTWSFFEDEHPVYRRPKQGAEQPSRAVPDKPSAIGISTDCCFEGEHPQHRVRITRPFYLGAYHVTQGEFRRFVNDTGYQTDTEKGKMPWAIGWNAERKRAEFNENCSWRNPGFWQTDRQPVVDVGWKDAVAFCEWLSRKEGKQYRLPTEAEWEYACRAGTTTRYYSGDDPEALVTVGNVPDATLRAVLPEWKWTIKANDGYAFTSPVGSFRPNAFGLYDMHGNAWQWCQDWYGGEYYRTSPADDPTGPVSGESRVLRGGSWYHWPGEARSANRMSDLPDWRSNDFGFRVAMTIGQRPKDTPAKPKTEGSARKQLNHAEATKSATGKAKP